MDIPRISRPYMPGYGILAADQGSGLLPWSWAADRLSSTDKASSPTELASCRSSSTLNPRESSRSPLCASRRWAASARSAFWVSMAGAALASRETDSAARRAMRSSGWIRI